MPELPEVETVRRSIVDRVVGQRIRTFRLTDFPGVLGDDRLEDVLARVVGHNIVAVRRRAKYLMLDLDDGTSIIVHLRMTGRLTIVPPDEPPLRFERLAIEFENGPELRFSDQRKFGRVQHLQDDQVLTLEQRLGPEPLENEFSASWLEEQLAKRRGPIKSILLNQGFIGGLGNIYVDESLYRARIHPQRVANSLSPDEVRRLHRAIREVLQSAVDGSGTSFSSFEDADGNRGRYGARLQVYGRGGKSVCPRCSTPLERTIVGGRGTSYCPTCQPITSSTDSW
jgi:formamidopyrimidine-DNA glycosylase